MQPVLLTVTGTGTSQTVTMDYMQNPFNVGIGVNVSGGTSAVGWRIEHTFDDLLLSDDHLHHLVADAGTRRPG